MGRKFDAAVSETNYLVIAIVLISWFSVETMWIRLLFFFLGILSAWVYTFMILNKRGLNGKTI